MPYRKMLIVTGVMLGFVLLVMVGEEAYEMQQAGWLPTTTIHSIENAIPAWAGVWLSVFPTVETIVAQAIAAALVLGSYFFAGRLLSSHPALPEQDQPKP
jgi:high-affinity iron transporter